MLASQTMSGIFFCVTPSGLVVKRGVRPKGSSIKEKWNALPPGTVSFCVHKISEADRQTVLPYLKSADVRMAFEKVDLGAADKRCILLPTLWACRPVSELKLGTGSRDSLVFGNQDSIVIVFLRFAVAYGCNFFWKSRQILCQKKCEIQIAHVLQNDNIHFLSNHDKYTACFPC